MISHVLETLRQSLALFPGSLCNSLAFIININGFNFMKSLGDKVTCSTL